MLIEEASTAGIIADLVWMISAITIENTMQNKINNYVNVSCANGVAMALNNRIESVNYFNDVDNSVWIYFPGDKTDIGNLIHFECAARRWSESKYLEYLDTKRSFGDKFGGVWFIYDTPESKQNAEDNIQRMTELMIRYGR